MRMGVYLTLVILLAAGALAQPIITDVDVRAQTLQDQHQLTITYEMDSEERLWQVDTTVILSPYLLETKRSSAGYHYEFNQTYTVPQEADLSELLLIVEPVQRDPTLQPFKATIRPLVRPNAQQQTVARNGRVDINIEPIRNIERGTTVLFPVTITNGKQRDVITDFTIEGTLPWATWGIRPTQDVLAAAGQTTVAYISLSVHEDAEPGMHDITITAEHDGESETVSTAVAVLAEQEQDDGLAWWVPWLVVLAIIVVAVLIAIAWRRKEEEDEDFITYY